MMKNLGQNMVFTSLNLFVTLFLSPVSVSFSLSPAKIENHHCGATSPLALPC